jgi:hypothetical protein
MVSNTVAAAVVGGTASVLGGGSFANGAVTASFGYLFNAASSRMRGTGHHMMARQIADKYDFSDPAGNVFDLPENRVPVQNHSGARLARGVRLTTTTIERLTTG